MKQIKNIVRKYGYDVVAYKTYNGKPDPMTPWETDDKFLEVYNSVVPVTLVDRKKLYMLWQLTRNTNILAGDIAECGVYRGGTALLLAQTGLPQKQLHLFDTFEGMPETDKNKDQHHAGDFNDTSLESVQKLFTRFDNVRFHKGFFPATAKGLETQQFSLVHCDMDIYKSVYDCCVFFYPLLVKGGILLFDDYGAPSCPGASKAVDEFCRDNNLYVIYLTSGQAMIVKY